MRRRRSPFGRLVFLVLLLVATAWSLFPFAWAIRNSIMRLQDTYKPWFIPFVQFRPTLAAWRDELFGQSELLFSARHSLVVALASTLIALILGTLAGYALARFRYRFPDNLNLSVWFLSQRVLPPAVVIVPFLLMMRSGCSPLEVFGLAIPQPLQLVCLATGSDRTLLNNLASVVIAHATFNMPFVVLIMRSIFRELPFELEEAALVDGASRLQTFWLVALPLAAAGLVAAGLISFAFSWNEFLFALILTGPDTQTLPLLIGSGTGVQGIQFNVISVRTLVAILPPVIAALLAQRYVVRGLTFGAVKG